MAYVVKKAGRHYAVIYEGTNPITGRERRRWHRCPSRAAAVSLARGMGRRRPKLRGSGSLLGLGDYLLGQWLPAREAAVTATTYASYVASVTLYLVPHLGRVQLRQLGHDQLTALYRRLATDGGRNGGPLAAKTILNLHQILRVALGDAVDGGMIPHNPADDVRPSARPAQATFAEASGNLMDRPRAGDLPRRHQDEPLLDVVPARRRNRDAPQ